jgi:hypothetical protein
LVKREVNRNVPSGKTWTVWFLAGANADCVPWREEASLTKKPEHGTVEIVPFVGVGNFAKESGLADKCNGKKLPGLNVNYKSFRGYTGPDEFELFVMLPGGGAARGRDWEMHFKINVR